MKILAVDDDLSIRELLPMILQKAGYEEVTVAGSADEALEIIRQSDRQFDCFLLDIQMPHKSGVELCADIRDRNGYADVPIVMLTAMHERDFVEQAFQAGANDYITKPFDIDEVGLRIRQVGLQRKDGATTVDRPDPDFAEPIDLAGVKGLVQRTAFENYVRQLSRSGLQATHFHATKVTNAGKLHQTLSPGDFRYALYHAADAIVDALSQDGILTMYSGAGVFVSSTAAARVRSSIDIENEIQEILDERDLLSELGAHIDLEIAVGTSVVPLPNAEINLAALEGRVISRADAREKQIKERPRPVEISRITR